MSPESQSKLLRGFESARTNIAAEIAEGVQAHALHRLSRLHEEAVETAQLANLLGRSPFVAWLLIAGLGVVALTSTGAVPLAPLVLWSLFTAASAIAILRLYQRTSVAAFELMPLRAFAADLDAALLFAGFAWGAGGFLALPPASNPVALLLFAAGTAAGVAALLRARQSLYFLVPAVVLPAIAAFLRPLPDAPLAATLLLLLGAGLAGATLLSGWWQARRLGLAPIVTFS
jgi:hypothetical protein